MANYANAYGAGAAVDALRQVLTDRIVAQRQAEDDRRARVAEAADQQRMAQQADQFRQQLAERVAERSQVERNRYEDRMADVAARDQALQERQAEREIAGKRETDAATREDARIKAGQAFQEHLIGLQQGFQERQAREARAAAAAAAAGPKAQIHWGKDADGNERAFRVGSDGTVTALDLPGTTAAGPSKADTFKAELDRFSSNVYNHPGLGRAGAGITGFTPRSYDPQFGNLQSAAEQLESLYLNDPEVKAKIAAQKPATDADVRRALRSAIGIDVEKMDEGAIKTEIDRLRTKAGLAPLGKGAPVGTDAKNNDPGGFR